MIWFEFPCHAFVTASSSESWQADSVQLPITRGNRVDVAGDGRC